MARSRGRPVRPIPVHPERVLSRAIKAGLSATIELQRNISNKETRKYYDRSQQRFNIRQKVYQITKERGSPDFSYISKGEAHIRDDIRLMFYEKAAKYGFTEVSRQKNADDTVDSLNQRFNACGKVIRENSEILFPHPDPENFGTYSRRDGKGRKKFRRAGYEGSSFGPRVILAHPDLPSLDFGDAVRSHNEYLATFCAIHDVPVSETTKYSQLFFLLVRPYLEYLYSEFKCGKSNFQKGVNWALRQVKNLILEAGYRPTLYEKRTVTKELEFDELKIKEENKRFFKKQEDEARGFYGNHPAVAELGRLRSKLGDNEDSIDEKPTSSENESKEDDDTLFTVKDVEYLRNEVSKRTRIAGSIMHRRLSDLFPSPWRLNDVIHSGDKYTHSTDYIIIAEVPIQTKHGAGKVDLILCERTISDDGKRVFWKPVLVLEIKTRLGQSWYIDANYKESEVRPDASPLQRIVSDFPLSNYPLSDDLWEAIVKSTPSPTAQKQLNIYCQALSESYKATTEQELGHILKGVVVIDSSSDITQIRLILERLIVHGYESVKERTHRLKRTVFSLPTCNSYRIALVLGKQPGLRRKEESSTKAPWVPTYTPFKTEKKNKREFLLYLAGYSPTSAGQSAAWNARYYHGLQKLYEMRKAQRDAEFIWVDLANQFNEPRLAEPRLRLRPRGYLEEERVKVQPDHIREFFESINVKGCLDDITSYLYNNGNLPSFDLKTRKNKRKVIIVTGVDTLRDATPTSHRNQFTMLIDHLLSSLPDDETSTIVWFDSPVPSVEKSIPYSSRGLLPFYETSSLGEVVTEIVWNLPIAPRGSIQPEKWGLSIIGDSPMHDDIRVIVHHTPTDFHTELIHIPFLRGWSKRFRNKGTGLVIQEREIDDIVPDKVTRNRMKLLSLTLLQWLVRLWPHDNVVEDSTETLEEQVAQLEREFRGGATPLTITKTVLIEELSKPPSLLDLVKFRLPATMDALSFQKMTTGKINSQRLYRSPRKLENKPLQEVPVPRTTEDVPTTEDELEQEWLFGVKFESEEDDIRSWWIVIQDPEYPSKMLTGCFTDRPPDKDGFLWAENKQEILIQSSLDEILGFPQTILIGRKKEESLEIWGSSEGDDAVYAGVLEVKGQGRSTTGHLRAIRQTFAEEPPVRPSFTIRPSESFYGRMIDSLRRQLVAVTSPAPVQIQLEMVDDICHVRLKDDEGEDVQSVTMEYTADLIAFLRRPMTKGEPMFTDSGIFVTWSVFDDIDYGDLDFIRPYVTYTAARKTPKELPKRVSQFFAESEELTVRIDHDDSVCPITMGEGEDHRACWRIELPSDCPAHVRTQLGRTLTGEEVNGLSSPGKIYAGKLYTFEFVLPSVSEKDRSIVFHEERYIRILLRKHGLPLKELAPGTFLELTNQKWHISIEWEDTHFKWQAQSSVSGLLFDGKKQSTELVPINNAHKECERLLRVITVLIPPECIVNYSKLEERILSGLRDQGYSKTSPACELKFIERTETICRYGLYLIDGSQSEPLFTGDIDATEVRDSNIVNFVIEQRFDSEEMSKYNITNKAGFLRKITDWVNEHVPNANEQSEGPPEWIVTLTENVETGEIHWVAEQATGDLRQTGTMFPSPTELQVMNQETASAEVQRIFESEVVPQLVSISNIDEVIEEQIPDVVRRIRNG